MDVVNIKSLSFNSMRSVIITNLVTSSNQNKEKIAYNVDTGSDSNLMLFNVSKINNIS